jgi:hypothetical protein
MSAPSHPGAGVGVGRLDTVVLDCPDPHALAGFYAGLLGQEVDDDATDSWVSLRSGGVTVAFQRAANYTPPAWPDGPPQQLHLDVAVADLVSAHREAVALGATPLDPVADPQPADTRGFRVYADPAGHPFCLCQS